MQAQEYTRNNLLQIDRLYVATSTASNRAVGGSLGAGLPVSWKPVHLDEASISWLGQQPGIKLQRVGVLGHNKLTETQHTVWWQEVSLLAEVKLC